MQNFGLLKVSLLVAYNTQLLGFAGNDIFRKSSNNILPDGGCSWWFTIVESGKKHIQPVRLFGLRS